MNNINTLYTSFIENRNTVKKVFSSESSYIIPISANVFCVNDVMADADELKKCKKLIKKNEGLFSTLRGNIRSVIAAKLSISDDPENKLMEISRINALLKKYFSTSDYSALLAVVLSERTSEDKVEDIAARGKEIYKLMKKDHPILTSNEDCVMAGLMAMSEKSNEDLLSEAEENFKLLRKKFSDKNAIQTVSQILALADGSPEEKTDRLIQLYEMLKENGRKFGKSSHLSTLASVSILPEDLSVICKTILEADDFLSNQKGYGTFGLDKKTRLMHAAMLTGDYYQPADNLGASASALALVAAEEAMMCAAIVGATIAASSAAYS
ncbi:MAG: DUF4003 family protein [Ruminococcus sp.]|jgi:hypothetical protein|nr:DUF4003 family protein [Ruminococcus sp.]